MIKLEETVKLRAETETEAQEVINSFRSGQLNGAYTLKKSGFEHKTKKSKGEIIDECWVVNCTLVYSDVWNLGEAE